MYNCAIIRMTLYQGPACARDAPTLILPDLTSLPVFMTFKHHHIVSLSDTFTTDCKLWTYCCSDHIVWDLILIFFLQVEYHQQADMEVDEITLRWHSLEPKNNIIYFFSVNKTKKGRLSSIPKITRKYCNAPVPLGGELWNQMGFCLSWRTSMLLRTETGKFDV